jgi:hypothetical protein
MHHSPCYLGDKIKDWKWAVGEGGGEGLVQLHAKRRVAQLAPTFTFHKQLAVWVLSVSQSRPIGPRLHLPQAQSSLARVKQQHRANEMSSLTRQRYRCSTNVQTPFFLVFTWTDVTGLFCDVSYHDLRLCESRDNEYKIWNWSTAEVRPLALH